MFNANECLAVKPYHGFCSTADLTISTFSGVHIIGVLSESCFFNAEAVSWKL
jgi:hypothetical protein